MQESEDGRLIHSYYLSSVLEYCVNHPLKNEIQFTAEGLLSLLKNKKSLSWDEILRGFPKVVERTRSYAQNNQLDPTSKEAARGYWLVEHNKIIDHGEEEYNNMPQFQKESCKTHLARIIRVIKVVKETIQLEVEYEDGKRVKIVDFIYGDLKEGDYISAHQNLTAERLTREEFDFYKHLRGNNH